MPFWLLSLLVTLPFAAYGAAVGWPPLAVFILAAVAIVPLAGLIGEATASLATQVGPTVGGLLNATFGNAAELIIGLFALAGGLDDVVRASIAGSVIGNSLLVLGTSMVVGGWRHRLQRFDARPAGQYAALLALAVVGLVIPTVVGLLGGGFALGRDVPTAAQIHVLSCVVAVVLLISYGAYIAHAVFGVRAVRPAEEALTVLDIPPAVAGGAEQAGAAKRERFFPAWVPSWLQLEGSAAAGAIWLAVATALTAFASAILVGAIEPVAHEVGLSRFFIGLIVLPIIGNAAEHASAIAMALRDRMDVTMAITAGSAIQVALLLAPVLVLVSAPLGHPLDFTFIPLELAIFALVALLYALVSLDGESTWLEGLLLVVFYVIVAAGAFVIPM
jgi:Ca2+:H+ antiporter